MSWWVCVCLQFFLFVSFSAISIFKNKLFREFYYLISHPNPRFESRKFCIQSFVAFSFFSPMRINNNIWCVLYRHLFILLMIERWFSFYLNDFPSSSSSYFSSFGWPKTFFFLFFSFPVTFCLGIYFWVYFLLGDIVAHYRISYSYLVFDCYDKWSRQKWNHRTKKSQK